MFLSLFPSLFDHPGNMRFAEQEQDENIELFLRQHGIVNLGWIIGSLLALIFPVIAIQFDVSFHLHLFSALPLIFMIAGLILWYLLVLAYVFEKFLYWYFNIYIITNQHLVDVDFVSLMYRATKEAQLEDVQDVTSTIKGVFGPLFNYGDVIIETASQHGRLTFENVPKPDFVADRIEDLRQTFDHKEGV
jgi:uncharacterized membrane protein YdbT with pleckstrin-like domain